MGETDGKKTRKEVFEIVLIKDKKEYVATRHFWGKIR